MNSIATQVKLILHALEQFLPFINRLIKRKMTQLMLYSYNLGNY